MIGERIKELRKKNNLTQSEFGSKIAISQTHISKIENGEEHISRAVIKLISIVFSVQEEWLLNGEKKR